jgi:16S rRNA processing protein RimM
MHKKKLVRIAKFGEPFGIRGGIKIWPFYDLIFELKKGQKLYISEGDTDFIKREVILEDIREHGKGYVIYFEEYKDRTSVEKLRGNWLLLEEEYLPSLPNGFYYTFQILGLSVFNIEGEFLGVVKEIISTGSNDVFVVEGKKGELLFPFIKDVVREIDISNKKIIIKQIEEI